MATGTGHRRNIGCRVGGVSLFGPQTHHRRPSADYFAVFCQSKEVSTPAQVRFPYSPLFGNRSSRCRRQALLAAAGTVRKVIVAGANVSVPAGVGPPVMSGSS